MLLTFAEHNWRELTATYNIYFTTNYDIGVHVYRIPSKSVIQPCQSDVHYIIHSDLQVASSIGCAAIRWHVPCICQNAEMHKINSCNVHSWDLIILDRDAYPRWTQTRMKWKSDEWWYIAINPNTFKSEFRSLSISRPLESKLVINIDMWCNTGALEM